MEKQCELNLYSNKYVNLQEQPLFFGCARNTQRYDKNKFEFYSERALTMQRLFWVPEEIKLQKDRLDKANATTQEDHLHKTQLQKLVMLDSLQGRSPLLLFGQLTTNPEFEACLIEQEYFESRIHSRSYSYLLEETYSNPDEVFKDSWKNKVLSKHTDTVIREYNILYDFVVQYLYFQKFDQDKLTDDFMYQFKKAIIKALVSMNILEGIRFYVGFASIWALTEFSGKFPGSSRILSLIQRDEKQHLAFTQFTINTLKKEKAFKDIWQEVIPEVYDMYFEASEEEFEWADHLYQYGGIMGMNAEIGKQYIKYLTNQRLRAIGLKPIYPEIQENPVKWTNKYINVHNVETSLQESEATDYILDPIDESNSEVLEKTENLIKLFESL